MKPPEETLTEKTGLTIEEDCHTIQTKCDYVLSAMNEHACNALTTIYNRYTNKIQEENPLLWELIEQLKSELK